MRKTLFILSLLGAGILYQALPVAAAGIGVITGLRGDATVRRDATPQPQALKFKDDVQWQDTLNTGADARLRLLILQKSVVTMKEQSQLQLREEAATPTQPKKKSVLNLLSGSVRVVVEKDTLKDTDFEVHTSVAVAGIRGSDLITERPSPNEANFYTGPGATATVLHTNPAIGTRDLAELSRARVLPTSIDVTRITLDQFRSLASATAPKGAQANGHRASATLVSMETRTVTQAVTETVRAAVARVGLAAVAPRGDPGRGPIGENRGPRPVEANLVIPPTLTPFTQSISGTFNETLAGTGRTDISGSYSGTFNGRNISGSFLSGSTATYVNSSDAMTSSNSFSGTLRGRFSANGGNVNLSSITFTESGHSNPVFSGSGSGVVSGGVLTSATLNGISFHDSGAKEADVKLKINQSP